MAEVRAPGRSVVRSIRRAESGGRSAGSGVALVFTIAYFGYLGAEAFSAPRGILISVAIAAGTVVLVVGFAAMSDARLNRSDSLRLAKRNAQLQLLISLQTQVRERGESVRVVDGQTETDELIDALWRLLDDGSDRG